MTEDIAISDAESAADMAEIRALFVEYQQWLGVDLCFQGFADEIDSLPGKYAPPAGRLLLARALDGAVAGGVDMWPLEPGVCEMKRLFVRPPWRGTGLGRRLAEAIVDAGRAAGHARMRLDTLPHLDAATALYGSMGFIEVAPYYDNPLPGVLYQNTGQEVKAREMYEAVLAIRPPDTEQFVIWNNIATKPIAEIASVNVALMQSGVVVEGMQRGAAGGQMDAAGNKVAGSMVTMKDAEARSGGAMGAPMTGTEADASMAAAPTGQAPEQAVVSGPMITRFADGDSHIVSRFITMRTLRDQELITPEEYAVRRQANVGALLPLTAPPPAAGLDRPVPTTEQIVGRIRAINRALQLRAMTVTQHAAERSMILDALMPAAPVVVANPPPPPEGLMEAADSVRRLEHLRDGNFITSDEYAKERAAVERGLQPEPPVRPAMTKPAEPMKMEKEMAAPSGPQPAVHLASYRSRKQAERGWSQLKRAYGALDSQVTPVNLGARKGTYYRLKAGPVANKGAAVDLCRKLKRRRQYCEPTIMENG